MVVLQLSPGEAEEICDELFGTVGMAAEVRELFGTVGMAAEVRN